MVICITNKCKMGCKHCMNNCKPEGKELKIEDIYNFANFFNTFGFSVLNISGGEPTEHQDFENIVFELMVKCKPVVATIISNGSFLESEEKIEVLQFLTKTFKNLIIQVTSVSPWYKNHDFITSNIEKFEKAFRPGSIVFETDCIRQMRPLGRAIYSEQAMNEVSKTFKGYTACTNSFLLAQQSSKLKDFAKNCESVHKFCMPVIGPDLNVYMSESMCCPSIGNLKTDYPIDIFWKMKNFKPCGKCIEDYKKFLNTK